MIVLDGSYDHPVSNAPRLTPQLRLSLANWRGAGLLDVAQERILFIQGIRPPHCDQMARAQGDTPFTVVGSDANVGIPNAQSYLVRAASMAHILYLERDYVTTDSRESLGSSLWIVSVVTRRETPFSATLVIASALKPGARSTSMSISPAGTTGLGVVRCVHCAPAPGWLVLAVTCTRTTSFETTALNAERSGENAGARSTGSAAPSTCTTNDASVASGFCARWMLTTYEPSVVPSSAVVWIATSTAPTGTVTLNEIE